MRQGDRTPANVMRNVDTSLLQAVTGRFAAAISRLSVPAFGRGREARDAPPDTSHPACRNQRRTRTVSRPKDSRFEA
jgi:hypothetical protein